MTMKNLIFCAVLLFAALGAKAQTAAEKTPAQTATEKLSQLYSLDQKQQAEMLKIQERKYRNLAEVEPLKATDPGQYVRKIQSIQAGNNTSFERIMTKEQVKILRQQQLDLRNKKAIAYKEMKSAGAQQGQIDLRMAELDLESL
jgi:hypothetical protein